MEAPPVQYVKTEDGYSIAYCVSGNGRPLVLMPAPFNNIQHYWTRLITRSLYEALSQRFTLIQYDGRGQGMSQRGLPADYTATDTERDLEAVVSKLGVASFVLMGFHNVHVAIRYTVQNSARVAALILWNASSGTVRVDATPRPAGLLEYLPEANWEMFVDTTARTTWAGETDLAQARDMVLLSTDQHDWVIGARARGRFEVGDLLPRVACPTLLIASHQESYTFATEQTSRRISAMIPNARLLVFDGPGGGLFNYLDMVPPGVLAIEQFVTEVAPESTAVSTPDGLTSREVEVLRLLATGMSNQQIADQLVISVFTVARHVSHIFEKADLANRSEATAYAHRNGLA